MHGPRSHRIPLLALALAALWTLAPKTSAMQVRSLNIEELTSKAGRIVTGRCVDVEQVLDPQLGVPVTVMRIEVERSLKGVSESVLTVKMLGHRGERGERTGMIGAPRFAVGEDLILFLYPVGPSGLTSPVGLGQGKFVQVVDKEGRVLVRNGFGNQRLFRGLSEAGGRILAPFESRWSGGAALPPEELVRMVESLRRTRK